VAESTAEQLRGETVEAVAGEANVELAIRDARATFAADEIVVAVRPEDEEGLVESKAKATYRSAAWRECECEFAGEIAAVIEGGGETLVQEPRCGLYDGQRQAVRDVLNKPAAA
jgi:hypothetical protein